MNPYAVTEEEVARATGGSTDPAPSQPDPATKRRRTALQLRAAAANLAAAADSIAHHSPLTATALADLSDAMTRGAAPADPADWSPTPADHHDIARMDDAAHQEEHIQDEAQHVTAMSDDERRHAADIATGTADGNDDRMREEEASRRERYYESFREIGVHPPPCHSRNTGSSGCSPHPRDPKPRWRRERPHAHPTKAAQPPEKSKPRRRPTAPRATTETDQE